MGLSRRKFTKEFKEAALRRLDLGASLAEVARACEVNPKLLPRWRQEVREHAEKAFPGLGVKRAEEERVAPRERKVGQQALEIDFWRQCWQHVEEQRKLQALISPRSSNNGSRPR
jgi:transposase